MRGVLVAAALAALGAAVLAGAVHPRGAEKTAPCRSALVPAYVPPAALIALAERPRPGRLVVVNPASGPGAARDPGYAEAVRALRATGMRALGYVATGFGARPAGEVAADVERYARWYGVDGIFLDETAHAAGFVGHYRELARVARGEDRLVVLNPGMVPDRGYFDLADVVVTFEGPAAGYDAARERMPAWLASVPAGRIAHLLYAADRAAALDAAAARPHAGYVFATSGELPNPWQALPDWLGEVERALEGC